MSTPQPERLREEQHVIAMNCASVYVWRASGGESTRSTGRIFSPIGAAAIGNASLSWAATARASRVRRPIP